MTDDSIFLHEDAEYLARQLFGNDDKKCASFIARLVGICQQAQTKDILIIHNPGGWGDTPLERCQQWERSIVEGVSQTIENMGYTRLVIQHFRTGIGLKEKVQDIKEQANFFNTKAWMMATELRFICRHVTPLRIILIGVSQGAAFTNAVLQVAPELDGTYSIEVGTPALPFSYLSRRVITKQTLALDNNGIKPDRVVEVNLWAMFAAVSAAPFRYLKYRLQGKPIKLTYCINVPGHDYNWEYPKVRQQIENFLTVCLGTRSRVGGKR
ncbi:MAG: hypothetical protein ABIH70_07605 [Chloroflexota bacterium]